MNQIGAVFNQLNQAYLIVSLCDWRPVLVNDAARRLLAMDVATLAEDALWHVTLKPLLQRAQESGAEPVFHYQGRLLQGQCSEVTEGSDTYLAIQLTLFLASDPTHQDLFELLDNLGAYVYCKDTDYNYTYANRQVCELFGYPLDEVLGKSDTVFFGEETGKKLVAQSDSLVVEQGRVLETEEVNYVPGADEYRHYLTVKKPLHNELGEITGLFGISTDITALKQTESRLFQSEQRLSTILDNVGAYIYIKDTLHRHTYVNRKTQELYGYNLEAIIGRNNIELLGETQGRLFDEVDRKVFETEQRVSCIETFDTGEALRYYWTVKIPLRNEAGVVDSYIGISTDITEQKQLEHQVRQANRALKDKVREISLLRDELREQSIRDPLTGLYNRRFMEEHAALVFSERPGVSNSLLMIDADHFKAVNDNLGHRTGDEMLQLLARVMQEACRATDLVCRYGGEEFLILLPDTDLCAATRKAETIRMRYEEEAGKRFPEACGSSISIGVATSPHSGRDFLSVWQKADEALYRAKARGRNCTEEA